MKAKLTLLCIFLTLIVNAQHVFFIHVALPENSSGNLTFLDHPMLNNNPNAHIIITHNFLAGDPNGVYNNNVTGVYYSEILERWTIFNENGNNIVNESAYNVYVETGPQAFVHISDASNVAPEGWYASIIDNGLMNGNPGAAAVFTNYYNAANVYNDHNYTIYYNTKELKWIIFNESTSNIPDQAAFFFVGGTNKNEDVKAFSYVATEADVDFEYIRLNHSYLNNNPDAIFVVSPNWGITGEPTNVLANTPIGVVYYEPYWYVYRENSTLAVAGTQYNIMIDSAFISTDTFNTTVTTLYPNPTADVINIQTDTIIDFVEIYNSLGQLVMTKSVKDIQATINVESLMSGGYIIRTYAENIFATNQFIKK